MRFGSVCSGIEAATVASAHLGWDAAWFSEIEKFPSAVLAHHYPNTPNHGDIMMLPLAIREGKVEAPDMLVGGTPCQAFSIAGRREGLEDARGNLTLTFCEIADAIDEVRHEQGKQPAIIFWENVPGVLSDKTNAFGCFLAELAGEEEPFVPPTKWTKSGIVVGPKRTIAWRTLDAQYFGLAQRRQRVFVIASSRTDIHPAKILLEFGGVRRDSAPCREQGKETAADVGTGFTATSFGQYAEGVGTIRASGGDLGGGSETLAIYENPPSDSRVTGPHSYSHTLTSKMGTGGGNVPLVGPTYAKGGEVCDTVCSKWQKGYGGPAGSETGNMVMQPVATQMQVRRLAMPDTLLYLGINQGDYDACEKKAHPREVLRTLWNEVGEEATTLWGLGVFNILREKEILRSRLHGESLRSAPLGESRVVNSPLPCTEDCSTWAMQSLCEAGRAGCAPQGWEPSEQLCDQLGAYLQELSQPGTSATQVLHDLWESTKGTRVLRETLSAIQEMGGRPNGEEQSTHSRFVVRRLTVTECERLMGFPDGYTNIPWRGKAESPDGPRYKALGNSWAVNCVRWIFDRIDDSLK